MADDYPVTSSSRDDAAEAPDAGTAPKTTAAARALAEAEARRLERRRAEQPRPREIDGRQGPEPVRYGDWENKGIASDF